MQLQGHATVTLQNFGNRTWRSDIEDVEERRLHGVVQIAPRVSYGEIHWWCWKESKHGKKRKEKIETFFFFVHTRTITCARRGAICHDQRRRSVILRGKQGGEDLLTSKLEPMVAEKRKRWRMRDGRSLIPSRSDRMNYTASTPLYHLGFKNLCALTECTHVPCHSWKLQRQESSWSKTEATCNHGAFFSLKAARLMLYLRYSYVDTLTNIWRKQRACTLFPSFSANPFFPKTLLVPM